jgi:hypothetical protein
VLDTRLLSRRSALAYWQGQYIAIDHNEDAMKHRGCQPAGSSCAPREV